MINQVVLGGKIVSSVELRRSKKGQSVCDFRFMHKHARAREPLFIDIEVWGNEAEKVAGNTQKGDLLVVHGELRRDVWEKDGNTRSKVKITASKVVLVTTENVSIVKADGQSEEDRAF